MKKLFWWNLTKEEKYHRFLWSIPIWVAAVITVCIKSPYPHNLIELVLLGDTLLRLSRNDHSQIRLIVTDLLFIMSPARKEKTSESFVILRIILSEAAHQTVIGITDYELLLK